MNSGFSGRKPIRPHNSVMSRFAAKSAETPAPQPSPRSARLLSLLVILETLRQEPVPLGPQKV